MMVGVFNLAGLLILVPTCGAAALVLIGKCRRFFKRYRLDGLFGLGYFCWAVGDALAAQYGWAAGWAFCSASFFVMWWRGGGDDDFRKRRKRAAAWLKSHLPRPEIVVIRPVQAPA